MSTQSFSPAALRRAWDLRVRKGENLQDYFPDLKPVHAEIREARRKKKDELRRYSYESVEGQSARKIHDDILGNLHEVYDQLLTDNLHQLSNELENRIQHKVLRIRLTKKPPLPNDPKQKPIYGLAGNDAVEYFLSRQIEHNIRTAFKIEAPNRNLATEQVLLALEKPSKKLVIRTDIAGYYEAVPHNRLRDFLRSNPSVTQTTIRYIEELLASYEAITGDAKGIPRGLAISAILGEAYLTQLDGKLKTVSGSVTYLRYVDDIVMILNSGEHLPSLLDHETSVQAAVQKLGLTLNQQKTATLSLDSTPKEHCFDYLGYEYCLIDGKLSIDITEQRLARYLTRITKTFDAYHKGKQDGRAQAMLHDRIRYLTSNTRLSNNRRQALVGIYFSNSTLLGPTPRLEKLDQALLNQLDSVNDSLKSSLVELTHIGGFTSRRYFKFSPKRLSQIVRAWKYDR